MATNFRFTRSTALLSGDSVTVQVDGVIVALPAVPFDVSVDGLAAFLVQPAVIAAIRPAALLPAALLALGAVHQLAALLVQAPGGNRPGVRVGYLVRQVVA